MQCERCNKKKATVFYRENIGGRVKALRLCGECAELLEQAGELEDMSIPLSGALSQFFLSDEGYFPLPFHNADPNSQRGAPRKCPSCGATVSDLSDTGKVGCAVCYSAFSEELSEVIRATHGRVEHRGRVSAGFRARKEKQERLEDLRRQLKKAVELEEFERAAELRDEIRGLESSL